MPYDEFLQSRFYKEWGRPQGLVDSAGVVLDRSGTAAAGIVVFRHRRNGTVDEETRRRMRLIVPHVRRAALIGKVIDLQTTQAATLADALDGVSAGLFLLDASGGIVHANAAGHALLDNAQVLRSAAGQLIANDPEGNRSLADALAAAGAGDTTVGVKGIALPLAARGGECYVAHVLPVMSGARRRVGTNYRATAALLCTRRHWTHLHRPKPSPKPTG